MRSREWVKRLPKVVSTLNNQVTRLIGMKPAVAIKEKVVISEPATKYLRPVGVNEKKLPSLVNVRYLYQPGELEGGFKRATDPIWSLNVYNIERSFIKPKQPVLYYLADGPKRGFVREELLVVPPNTQLPPSRVSVLGFKLDHCGVNSGIQLVRCVFRRAIPIVCHNKHSTPASPVRKLLYSHPAFETLCLLPCLYFRLAPL